ncbi:MAG: CoA-acylating methylmalonate-semialdehyde dehydrogenase [Bacteroidetes bacterium]|nr:CoA-acylating methylmalonate-semialdehyde dehydrogenase [Bacteroidota bacterium]
MSNVIELDHFIGGKWRPSQAGDAQKVINPATGDTMANVSMASYTDVDVAVREGQAAFRQWRRTPVTERIRYLFAFREKLEYHFEDIARSITKECGKTIAESRGELRRGIENVEVACGTPILMQGYNNEDIASGIDEHMIRQPLGVVVAITPFNFPSMIPLWFLPYAIATGNCFILKPSEKVPQTSAWLVRLLDEVDLPAGVVQLVHGGKEAVDALIEHPGTQAVSFVGSTTVARYVYAQSAANGKRVQCQGGAKNVAVVLEDAVMDMTSTIVADSAFGCAGQRCLANSLAVTVGGAQGVFTEAMVEAAHTRRVGYGLDEHSEMGPVITPESQSAIEGLVDVSEREGAQVLVDGRGKVVDGFQNGNWIFPTLIDNVDPTSTFAQTEAFGPVFGLMHTDDLDGAIELINSQSYGNMACLFTSDGAAARKFRYEADAGNIGINLGVAAPMAFYPFSGWKDSFFGSLHAQGRHGIKFYTQTKVVVERWPSGWSRKF